MAADPRVRGTVLDVGCGPDGPTIPHYFPVYRLPARLEGVDPMPGAEANPWADRAWRAEFDHAPIPAGRYDALVAVNVVEHVVNPATFLRQAFRVLKPGGRIYAVTPNGVHPFAPSVRLVQALGLKGWMVKDRGSGFNAYPAYYRLNSRRSVTRHGTRAGFAAARFVHLPNTQWAMYFPRVLRVLPWAFDAAIGTRVPVAFQMLLWSLEKPGMWRPGELADGPVERPRAVAPALPTNEIKPEQARPAAQAG